MLEVRACTNTFAGETETEMSYTLQFFTKVPCLQDAHARLSNDAAAAKDGSLSCQQLYSMWLLSGSSQEWEHAEQGRHLLQRMSRFVTSEHLNQQLKLRKLKLS